jgi:hypothetical protein
LNTAEAPSAASPLWIMALFIGLCEAAAVVAAATTDGGTQTMFAIFAVAFPLIILGTFVWLLLTHPANLYSPSQYTDTTTIDAYVAALRRESRDSRAVLQDAISEALVTTVTAEQGERPGRLTEDLRAQVTEAIEGAVDRSSVTVDRSAFGEDGDEPIRIPVTRKTTVQALLDSIYFELRPAVEPFTYGSAWVLFDEGNSEIEAHGMKRAFFKDTGVAVRLRGDTRRLAEAGITPGMHLTARPLVKNKAVEEEDASPST